MAASDYVSENPELTLALKGASTDGKRTFNRSVADLASKPDVRSADLVKATAESAGFGTNSYRQDFPTDVMSR